MVAIPSQTQLQEDLPEDVRGRVFGVLNMLVSVSSFLPIIIVGPISDLIGTTSVILLVGDRASFVAGVASCHLARPVARHDRRARADPQAEDPIAAALGADRPTWHEDAGAPASRRRPRRPRRCRRRRAGCQPTAGRRRRPSTTGPGRPRRPTGDLTSAMPLDLLITGRIATLAGDAGFGWVEAIGIRDGRIAFAGSEVELETRADPFTRRLALEPDEVAIPGLTDAHLHLAQAALAPRQVDLTASRDPRGRPGGGSRAAHAARSPRPGCLARGARLGHRPLGRLADRRRPRAGRAGPPGRALGPRPPRAVGQPRGARGRRASARRRPPGGVVRRGPDGSPEGVLYETAARLVTIHVPPASDADLAGAPSSRRAGSSSRSASSPATTRAASPRTPT